MNKYDEKYDIRLAHYDEIPEIMEFLDKYWKKGHILARDRAFFEYEMVVDGQVNFIVAKDWESNKIFGLHGFLPASKNKQKLDIWGSIWKVCPGAMILLGLEIVKRAGVLTGARNFLSTGGSTNTTVPINKSMLKLDDVGKMQHFYCLAEKKDYKVAVVKHYEKHFVKDQNNVFITSFKDFSEVKNEFDFNIIANCSPFKDSWYIEHRFFCNPIYKYKVYGLKSKEQEKKIQALLICREQSYNGVIVLRIVDYLGNQELFGGLSLFFEDQLKKYEYIDFYSYGFDNERIKEAGMIELQDNDSNIIPNYFNPFVAQNVDIWVGTPKGKATFFKADGDQDRPV